MGRSGASYDLTLTTTAIKTTTYTAAPWELVRCDASAGSFTVTLPAANSAGQQVAVELLTTSGTFTVTVARAGSDTINAAGTSVTLTLTDEAVVLTSNGAGVWTIAQGRVTTTSMDARYATISAAATTIPADLGYLAWSYPPALSIGLNAMPTSGRLELVRLPRVPAGTVTNIVIQVSTAGNTLTSGQCFAVLYSTGGVKRGVTADQAVAWASTGRKVMALTAPYANPTQQDLYAGFWFVGTTGPTIARGSNVATTLVNAALAAPNLFYASADTGLTTTAPDPFGTQTGTALAWWVGLS